MRTIMEAENHTTAESAKSMPRLISVNVSSGGIPRLPVTNAYATPNGLREDHRAHEKHRRQSARSVCSIMKSSSSWSAKAS